MTPAELRSKAVAHYGEVAWKKKLAWHLGVSPRTVDRWMTGGHEIPKPAALAVSHLSSPDR
jgi:DNA-binding transcriptional regulator YdaS (Cro superfamily)